MDIEETKMLAQQGSVDAMMALAEHYAMNKDDEDSVEVAFRYYELAANAGEPSAILKMARKSNLTAGAFFTMLEHIGRDEGMIKNIEEAYRWAYKLVEAVRRINSASKETVSFAEDNLLSAISRLSAVYYYDKKYDDMVRISKDVDHPYAQVIYGLALFELAETDEECARATPFLKNLENAACWKEDYQTAKFSQVVLAKAATYLSILYRLIYHNIDASRAALMLIVNFSQNEMLRDQAKEDVAEHYKKKLLGGYSYVK